MKIFLAIILLILVFGIAFFVSQKIAGQHSKQVEGVLEDQEIILPVKVHLIKDENAIFTTKRNISEMDAIFAEVNRIWSQAKIKIEITEIVMTNISAQSHWQPSTLAAFLTKEESYNNRTINAYFVGKIGANGVAIKAQDLFFVADYTSVNDYRATSHELGHLLGLNHINDSRQGLMFQGVNGEDLTDNEIAISRQTAIDLLSNFK